MSKKTIFLYILIIPLAVSLIGSLLLLAVSFVPDSLLWDHALASAYQLNDEGQEDNFFSPAGRSKYSPDNYTDSLIIQTACTLNREHPENVLLNKIAVEPQRYSQRAHLVDTVEGTVTATESYSRYWMGFRVFVRPLLVLTAYRGIRVIAAALGWILLALAVATTAKRGSVWTAAALAGCVGLVEPYAIVSSLQFSTCFLLALGLIVWLNCADIRLGGRRCFTAFCLLGALTQFFDFYTTPLIVYALPVLVLAARHGRGERLWRPAGVLLVGWFGCWLLTWLYKLCFVSLFTADRGFADAFASLAQRLGFSGHRVDYASYSAVEALRRVWNHLGLPDARLVLPALGLALAALWLVSRHRDRGNAKPAFYLAAACLPVLWMAASAQPIYIHYWFQYRSLCVSCFALLLYVPEAIGLTGGSRLSAKVWKSK